MFCSTYRSPRIPERAFFEISDVLFCAQESQIPESACFEMYDVLFCAQESQHFRKCKCLPSRNVENRISENSNRVCKSRNIENRISENGNRLCQHPTLASPHPPHPQPLTPNPPTVANVISVNRSERGHGGRGLAHGRRAGPWPRARVGGGGAG